MLPTYQGSDAYEAEPLPLVDVQYGRFFAKVGQGIGFYAWQKPSLTAGVSVNWMRGYDGNDVPAGIEEVDSALGARLFVSAPIKGVVATLAATQAVTDDDRGLTITGTLAYPIHPSESFSIVPSIAVTWANEKYMDGYFGISPSEASASGLAEYAPSNGFKDLSFRISARYRMSKTIAAVAAIGVTHLLDEAAHSPLVEEQTQPIALLGLTYDF